MKTIINYFEKEVKQFNTDNQTWEVCNFQEAGITDLARCDILQALDICQDEAEFNYNEYFTGEELDEHFGFNPITDMDYAQDNVSDDAMFSCHDGVITVVIDNAGYGTYAMNDVALY